MKLVDESVVKVHKVREKLIAKYGGLDGWIDHLQAMGKKRAKKNAKRSAASTKTTRRKPKRKR